MKKPRANYFQFIGSELERMNEIESSLEQCPLGKHLLELVKLRVSLINGCSFCVLLHSQRLRLLGESSERIDMISVWHEATCYSEQELAALRWAEAVTRLADASGISDDLYSQTVAVFGEEGLSQLTLAVAMINNWNRLAISFKTDHKFVAELLKRLNHNP